MVVTGEMRRWCETVEEIELLAQAEDPQAVVDAFQRLSLFREVVEAGPQGALALTRERYPVRLHVVAPGEWGPALQRTTGSTAHNAQLRGARRWQRPSRSADGGPGSLPESARRTRPERQERLPHRWRVHGGPRDGRRGERRCTPAWGCPDPP